MEEESMMDITEDRWPCLTCRWADIQHADPQAGLNLGAVCCRDEVTDWDEGAGLSTEAAEVSYCQYHELKPQDCEACRHAVSVGDASVNEVLCGLGIDTGWDAAASMVRAASGTGRCEHCEAREAPRKERRGGPRSLELT